MGFNFANPYADVTAQGAFTPESMAENEYVAQQLVYVATESANDKDEAAGVEIPPEWEDNPVPPDPSPGPPPNSPFSAAGIVVASASSASGTASGGPPVVGASYTVAVTGGTDPGVSGTVTVSAFAAGTVTFSTPADWTSFVFTDVIMSFTPV